MFDVLLLDGCFYVLFVVDNVCYYVVFVVGSGIMFIFLFIKMMLVVELQSCFMLVYGNCSVDSIIFGEVFEDLKDCYFYCFVLYYVLLWQVQEIVLFNGWFDGVKVCVFLDMLIFFDDIDVVFICGLLMMIDVVEVVLFECGVLCECVYVECFGVLVGDVMVVVKLCKYVVVVGDVVFIVVFDGKLYEVLMVGDVKVLDSVLSVGLDLFYVCKGGVCCMCCVKVLEGCVEMDKNFILEDWEIQQGFVLICQVWLFMQCVVVSYDEC